MTGDYSYTIVEDIRLFDYDRQIRIMESILPTPCVPDDSRAFFASASTFMGASLPQIASGYAKEMPINGRDISKGVELIKTLEAPDGTRTLVPHTTDRMYYLVNVQETIQHYDSKGWVISARTSYYRDQYGYVWHIPPDYPTELLPGGSTSRGLDDDGPWDLSENDRARDFGWSRKTSESEADIARYYDYYSPVQKGANCDGNYLWAFQWNDLSRFRVWRDWSSQLVYGGGEPPGSEEPYGNFNEEYPNWFESCLNSTPGTFKIFYHAPGALLDWLYMLKLDGGFTPSPGKNVQGKRYGGREKYPKCSPIPAIAALLLLGFFSCGDVNAGGGRRYKHTEEDA